MAEPITVKTVDVVKEFRMGGTVLQALKGVDLEIAKGEYISIAVSQNTGSDENVYAESESNWITILSEGV